MKSRHPKEPLAARYRRALNQTRPGRRTYTPPLPERITMLKSLLFRTLNVAAFIALGGLAAATAQGVPIRPTGLPTPTAPARPVPEIVQKWMTAWNRADARGMAELFTADGSYENFAFQAESRGRDGIVQWVAITAQNIPDAHGRVIDAFRVGDRVAVKWIFSGTPLRLGPTGGTGASFAVPAVSYFELRGGRIRRVSDFYNVADLLRQLGLPSGAWTPPAP